MKIKRPGWLKSRRRKSAERRARIIGPILDSRRKRKANGQK